MKRSLFKEMKKMFPVLRELSATHFSQLTRGELFLISKTFNENFPKTKITYVNKKTSDLAYELFYHVGKLL